MPQRKADALDLYEVIPVTRPFDSQITLWSFQPKPEPDLQYCHASRWPLTWRSCGVPITSMTRSLESPTSRRIVFLSKVAQPAIVTVPANVAASFEVRIILPR